MFLCFFSVQQTTYRIGNHVYYWVPLRPETVTLTDGVQAHLLPFFVFEKGMFALS